MDKLEKVIKGYEHCLICGIAEYKCEGCPYISDASCITRIKRDALELLKEQEAMNIDSFVQWCVDSHIMRDASVKRIKYWAKKFKEVRRVEC